eukprot:827935-Alexandrium_andersonii.AAC.1
MAGAHRKKPGVSLRDTACKPVVLQEAAAESSGQPRKCAAAGLPRPRQWARRGSTQSLAPQRDFATVGRPQR